MTREDVSERPHVPWPWRKSTRGPISRFATGQYEFRRPTETAVDRSIRYTNAQKVELGEGQIRVDFHNALHGMQTHTGGGGAVRNTRLSQTPQMNTTGSYGTDSANQYAEE